VSSELSTISVAHRLAPPHSFTPGISSESPTVEYTLMSLICLSRWPKFLTYAATSSTKHSHNTPSIYPSRHWFCNQAKRGIK
jgi:hypothetical protein